MSLINTFASCFQFLQITEVHTCLDAKMLESPNYSLKEMVNIAQTMDKVRADLGLVYPQDECKPLVPP